MQKSAVSKIIFRVLVFMGIFSLAPSPAFSATFISGDLEKPKPEFTREGDVISAKLLPRAKSTKVVIRFKVNNGNLDDVKGVDFFACDRPEVNVKNFKSALFEVTASGIPKGGDAKISIISQFFISSTQFYIFNESQEKPWMIPEIQNISLPDRVQELIITVKDGGPYDSDGVADGKIRLIGGPRDSFWGYALGTLFIRFFGIFLVLGVLMIGMMLSGRFFTWYEGRKSLSGKDASQKDISTGEDLSVFNEPVDLPGPGDGEKSVSGAMAAAIALALHLHQSSSDGQYAAGSAHGSHSNAWTQTGRVQMMNDRLMIFNR
jgi:hypothetical protein